MTKNKKLIIFIMAILLLVIAVFALSILLSPAIKKIYIQNAINKANYCETASDCKFIEPKCPFGCAIYVNKKEYSKIAELLGNYRTPGMACMYSCIATTPTCENNKCKSLPKSETNFEINSFIFSNDDPDSIIRELLKSINGTSSIKFIDKTQATANKWLFDSQWWISDDGWNILDKNVSSIVSAGSLSENSYGYSDVLSPGVEKLNEQISKIFLDNGFALNEKNTSDPETQKDFYDSVTAFQKGETRCTLTLNKDFSIYAITCSDNFKKAYDEQIPYLKALNITNNVVSDIKRVGNYAKLNVNWRRTGHYKIIKIAGNKMEEIFSGQEYPLCELMDKYEIPKEIYENCYLDKDGYNRRF